jgi:rRNA maturation endonuclease Nob1
MGIRDILPKLITTSGSPATHIECRQCGTSFDAEISECPDCGGDIVVYHLAD